MITTGLATVPKVIGALAITAFFQLTLTNAATVEVASVKVTTRPFVTAPIAPVEVMSSP